MAIGFVLLMWFWMGQEVSHLAHTVNASIYSVSLPVNWYVQKDAENDSIYSCNAKDGDCTPDRGGLPRKGKMLITIMPDEKHPDHVHYSDLDAIMQFELKQHRHAQPIKEVTLRPTHNAKPERCLLIRSTIGGDKASKDDKVWTDFYGWNIDGKLFRAITVYNDDPSQNEQFRSLAIEIISSVTLR